MKPPMEDERMPGTNPALAGFAYGVLVACLIGIAVLALM
jgi:hypothetical protein